MRCIDNCPKDAISVKGGKFTIDNCKCDNCGICIRVCPCSLFSRTLALMSVDEVLSEVMRDKTFFEVSGGGLTVSGGEPLLQGEFLKELLCKAKDLGIQSTIETALFVNYESLKTVLPSLDNVIFDLKHVDPVKHKEYTGVDCTLIKQNILKLTKENKNLLCRVLVVKGFNDTIEDVRAMGAFLKKCGILQIELLKCHDLASSKYAALGNSSPYDGFLQKEVDFEAVCRLWQTEGFTLIHT